MAEWNQDQSGYPRMKRWDEQRWLIDAAIRTQGIEFDQGRLSHIVGLVGAEMMTDVNAIRGRVNKFDDIAPALEHAARQRQARAEALEAEGNLATASESYFIAAQFWASAQWPILVNNEQNRFYAERKLDCYARYGKLADHHVERLDVPFRGKKIPAWLHLPPGHSGGRIPGVVAASGMDGYKERVVAMYGDRFLRRGMAVLLVEGPGQYDAIIQDIPVTTDGWAEAGRAFYETLAARPELDPERIGITGHSFGSFFMTVAASGEPRYRCASVSGTCLEPGGYSIFEQAPPSFKRRFMYMSGYTDEAKFDEFRKTLTWEGHAKNIRMPYLCVTGEVDDKSPLVHTERMFQELAGPKMMIVYQSAAHSVSGTPSAANGPFWPKFLADWMAERLAGKPMASERLFVDAAGKITRSGF